MDLELSAEQEALLEGVRKLCEGRFPVERVRQGFDSAGWHELAEAGVFSLRLPEADGGVGLGMGDAVLVFEELGRALVPGPLVATHLAAGRLDGVIGLAEARRGPLLVEHLASLDHLVVLDDGGLCRVDPRALDAVEVLDAVDPLTPLHHVASVPEGEVMAGAEEADRWRQHGKVLTAALQLGIAEAATDLAVAYAKERQQFDRPIGSFQAVKHLLADMLVRTEVARAAVYAAGVTVDQPDVGDVGRAAATAKLLAGEAATANGKTCIQVHGGMGFTWEVDAHLYLKRAWSLDVAFGGPEEQAAAIAEFLAAGPASAPLRHPPRAAGSPAPLQPPTP